jgi:hypothetical protein
LAKKAYTGTEREEASERPIDRLRTNEVTCADTYPRWANDRSIDRLGMNGLSLHWNKSSVNQRTAFLQAKDEQTRLMNLGLSSFVVSADFIEHTRQSRTLLNHGLYPDHNLLLD